MAELWFEVTRHHQDPHDELRSTNILADIDKALKRAEKHTVGFKATIHEEHSQEDSGVVSIKFAGDARTATESLNAALGSEHLQAHEIDGRRFSA